MCSPHALVYSRIHIYTYIYIAIAFTHYHVSRFVAHSSIRPVCSVATQRAMAPKLLDFMKAEKVKADNKLTEKAKALAREKEKARQEKAAVRKQMVKDWGGKSACRRWARAAAFE